MNYSINNGSDPVVITVCPDWSVFSDKVKSIVNFKAKSKGDKYFDLLAITGDEETVIGDLIHGSRARLLSKFMGFNRHLKVEPVKVSPDKPEEEKRKAKYAFTVSLPAHAAEIANSFLINSTVSEFYVNDVIAEWLSTLGMYEESAVYKQKADMNLDVVFMVFQSFVTVSRSAKELNV